MARAVRSASAWRVVDDIAIVKSLTTDAFNHAPGR
jgi:hypothetical protein